jgi:hypothetical protein
VVRTGDSKIYATIADHAGRAEAIELDVGAVRYADLARVLGYWQRKRGDVFAPRRADIDPIDLIEALPRIMLVDVVPTVPIDFRYRLSGTGICDVHGANHTHKSPRDLIPPAYGELIYEHYRAAVERRVPLLHLIALDIDDRKLSYVRLLLPLSEDGASVTMLMTVDSKEQNTRALKDYFAEVSRGGD